MASPFYAIRNFFRGPGAPPVETGLQSNLPVYGSTAATEVSFDSAMQVSAVWAAARIISETIGSLPFNLYRLNADGTREVASNDLQKILTKTPNQYQTPVEFWETMALNLCISGNAYAVKQRSGSRLVGLLPLSSSQVESELLADGTLIHKYTQGSNVKVYSSDNVWHVKLFGNGLIGMSPLSYARDAIGIAQAADNRVSKIYSNGAKPSGVLTIDRTLTAEQRAQIKANFQELESGNEDRLFVLEAGMQYQQTSMSPQDIELLNSRRFQIEDIGRFFGVPSILLNQTFGQSSLGSNVYEIMAAFYKLNLRPYLEKFESSILRWLVDPRQAGQYEARFDFDALLRADTLSRMQANREAINSGQLTPNEARALEGRGAMEGGDTLLIQGAMIPIEKAGEEPPEPPAPPEPPPMAEEDEKRHKSAQFDKSPQMNIKFEPHISVSQPEMRFDNHVNVAAAEAPEVQVDVHCPEPNITVEATMPEQKFDTPIVNVEVQPAAVTVVDSHPTRAVQTVERDENDEIARTIINYEKG